MNFHKQCLSILMKFSQNIFLGSDFSISDSNTIWVVLGEEISRFLDWKKNAYCFFVIEFVQILLVISLSYVQVSRYY